jgi:hypothetical protein
MSRALLCLLLSLLAVRAGHAAESANRFDGDWDTVLSCPNSNGALGFPSSFRPSSRRAFCMARKASRERRAGYSSTVRSRRTAPGSLYASGLVGAAEMAVGHRPPGTQYGYHVDVQFTDNSGKGHRVEGRPCTVSFAKKHSG